MRRLRAAVGLAYTMSFVVACLAGCLGPAAAQHGCCRGEQGFQTAEAGKDCCKIEPGVSEKCFVVAAVVTETRALTREVVSVTMIAYEAAPAPAAAGPPFVLRI
jgi:hypothetical protein